MSQHQQVYPNDEYGVSYRDSPCHSRSEPLHAPYTQANPDAYSYANAYADASTESSLGKHSQPQYLASSATHFQRYTKMTRSIAHYHRICQIGEGTYGQVYKARSLDNGRIVALKKIRLSNVDKSSEGMPRTVIREIKILRALRHENMVEMVEVVSSKGYEHLDQEDERMDDKRRRLKEEASSAAASGSKSDSQSGSKKGKKSTTNKTPSKKEDILVDMQREKFKGNLFIVLEYVSNDLSGILDMGFRFNAVQAKCIFRQLLSVLGYMHENRYVHRDLKSSNLLIDSNYRVKLADFGLARSLDDTFYTGIGRPEYTNKVVTLWYRPPELLFGATQYDEKVDIWSAGCILAELLFGKTIFPGKNEMEQINLIFELMGTPSRETWEGLEDHVKLRTKEIEISEVLVPTFKQKYSSFVTGPNEKAALSLMERLLALNPKMRLRAGTALQSQYFKYDPIAPDNPAELGSLDVGGDSHEFETKPIRKEAKVHAQKAAAEAKILGLDEKTAFEGAYNKFLKDAARKRSAGRDWNSKDDESLHEADSDIAVREQDSGPGNGKRSSDKSSKRHRESSKSRKSSTSRSLDRQTELEDKVQRKGSTDKQDDRRRDRGGSEYEHLADKEKRRQERDERRQKHDRSSREKEQDDYRPSRDHKNRDKSDKERGKDRDKHDKGTKRSKKHKDSRNEDSKERKRRKHDSDVKQNESPEVSPADDLNDSKEVNRNTPLVKDENDKKRKKSEHREKDKKRDRSSSRKKSSHERKASRRKDEKDRSKSRSGKSHREDKHRERSNKDEHKGKERDLDKGRDYDRSDRMSSSTSQREWEREAEYQLRNEHFDANFEGTTRSHYNGNDGGRAQSRWYHDGRPPNQSHHWPENQNRYQENHYQRNDHPRDFHHPHDKDFNDHRFGSSPPSRGSQRRRFNNDQGRHRR